MAQFAYGSKGAYDFNTVYNMPIWMRNFHMLTVNHFKEKEIAQTEGSNTGTSKKGKTLFGPGGKSKDIR